MGKNNRYKSKSQNKTFHVKDIENIKPITKRQSDLFNAFQEDFSIIACLGYAGTGKTFLSIYNALKKVLDSRTVYDKIVIIRSSVQSRDMGFLPGDLEQKIEPYEKVYSDIFDELFPWKRSYEHLKEIGKVEFLTTSFLRGSTFDRSLIVVDEIANMNFQELDLIMTRMGIDSKLIFCGDYIQTDLSKKNDQSGLPQFMKILYNMEREAVEIIEFEEEDIVRSDVVKEYILARKNVFDE